MVHVDPLFEFDAPQFKDLSAPLPPYRVGERDPWFDVPHPDHSRPSAELAEDLRKYLEREQQLKDRSHTKTKSTKKTSLDKETRHAKPKSTTKWGIDKENRQPNKQLKHKHQSLKEIRAEQEPFQVATEKTERKRKPLPLAERKDAGNRQGTAKREETSKKREKTEMKSLEALLARHNNKFKTVHTYEPPQHSVRDVKQWEREMKKSFYALSAEERVQANQEIAVWKKRRVERTQ